MEAVEELIAASDTLLILFRASFASNCSPEATAVVQGTTQPLPGGVRGLVIDMDESDGEEIALELGVSDPGSAFVFAKGVQIATLNRPDAAALAAALTVLSEPGPGSLTASGFDAHFKHVKDGAGVVTTVKKIPPISQAPTREFQAIEVESPAMARPGHLQATQMRVQGICCAAEVKLVKKLLEPVDGVAKVGVDQVSRIVIVDHFGAVTAPEELVQILNGSRLGAALLHSNTLTLL